MKFKLRSCASTSAATGAERTDRTSRCEPQSVGSSRRDPWVARQSVTAVSAGHVHRSVTGPSAVTSYRSTPGSAVGVAVTVARPVSVAVRCVRPSGERISNVVTLWTIAVKLVPKKVLTELVPVSSFSANIRFSEETLC